jgi:hypothetical protein
LIRAPERIFLTSINAIFQQFSSGPNTTGCSSGSTSQPFVCTLRHAHKTHGNQLPARRLYQVACRPSWISSALTPTYPSRV